MPELFIRFGGLDLNNPIIVSAGPCTRNERLIKKMADAGAAAIVTKSTFTREDYDKLMREGGIRAPVPGRYPDARPKFTWVEDVKGYAFIAGLAREPADVWVQYIKRIKKEVKIPIVAGIMGTSREGYSKIARIFEDSGADGLEISFTCPMPFVSMLERPVSGIPVSWRPDIYEEIAKIVKEEVSIPIGTKVTPNPLEPAPLLERAASKVGVNWLTYNYYVVGLPPVDVETGRPYRPFATSGISGPIRKFGNFFFVSRGAKELGFNKVHLSASGGIFNWEDAVTYIMYGCTAVQMTTAILRKGPGVIKEINKGIRDFMERKGYDNLTDFRGAALKHQLTPSRILSLYEETKGTIVADIDKTECNLCGICEKTCLWDAIKIKDGEMIVDLDKCEGCGLCEANCPVGAVRLTNVDKLFKT